MPTQMNFKQLLILVNLYQHAKNKLFYQFVSEDIVDLKILQSEHFWLISQEHDFSQKWDLCRTTTNNIYLHYRTNLVTKLMTKFFQ